MVSPEVNPYKAKLINTDPQTGALNIEVSKIESIQKTPQELIKTVGSLLTLGGFINFGYGFYQFVSDINPSIAELTGMFFLSGTLLLNLSKDRYRKADALQQLVNSK